jgi:hypothetical protein
MQQFPSFDEWWSLHSARVEAQYQALRAEFGYIIGSHNDYYDSCYQNEKEEFERNQPLTCD